MGFFGEIIVLEAQQTTYVFIALLMFLLIFKAVLHIIEMYCNRNGFKDLLENLYREFMMMGLISFGTFISNEAYDSATSELYTAFHFAHLTILFIGLAFILQAILLISLVATRKRTLLRFSATSSHQLLAEYDSLMSSNDLKSLLFRNGPLSMSFPELREQIEIRILKDFFIRSFNLPEEFNFAVYTCRALKKYVISLSEVRPISWLILAFFLALNYGKIIVLDDELKTLHCYVDGRPPLVSTTIVRRSMREYTDTGETDIGEIHGNMNMFFGVVARMSGKLVDAVHTMALIIKTTTPASSINHDYSVPDVQYTQQDYYNSSKRFLSASASDTELCREYMLSYAIFCAFMLSLFLFILLVFSEIYMRRLLGKVLLTEIDLEWEEEDNEKEVEEENNRANEFITNLRAKEMLELENNSRNNSQNFDDTKVIDKNIHHSNVQAVHFNSTQGSSSHPDAVPLPLSAPASSLTSSHTSSLHLVYSPNGNDHISPMIDKSVSTVNNAPTGLTGDSMDKVLHIRSKVLSRVSGASGNRPRSLTTNSQGTDGRFGEASPFDNGVITKSLSSSPRNYDSNVRAVTGSTNSPKGSGSFMTPSMRRDRSQSFSVSSPLNLHPHHISHVGAVLPPSIIHEREQQQQRARARSNTFVQYMADSIPVKLTSSRFLYLKCLQRICHSEEERHLRNSAQHERDANGTGNAHNEIRNSTHNGSIHYNTNNNNDNNSNISNNHSSNNNNNDSNNNNNNNDSNKEGFSNINTSVKGFQRNPMLMQNTNNDKNIHKNQINKNNSIRDPQAESDNSNSTNKSILSQIFKTNSEKNREKEEEKERDVLRENNRKEEEVNDNEEHEKEKESRERGRDEGENMNRHLSDGEDEKEIEKEKKTMSSSSNDIKGSERGGVAVQRKLVRTRSATAENILSRATFQSQTQSSKSAAIYNNTNINSSSSSVSSHPSMQRDVPPSTIYLPSLTPEDKLESGLSSVSFDLGSESTNSPKSPFFTSKLWSNDNDNNHHNHSHDIENSLSINENTTFMNSENTNNSNSGHATGHSNSYPNFTATGSPILKNQKSKIIDNTTTQCLPSPNDSDSSNSNNNSNNNSLSKKKILNNLENSSNFHEKTENLLQPRGRMKRAYSDIFFQMAPPENHNSTSTSTTNANTRTNSTTGSNNSDLLRLKKLAEIDRQKKKASEKKSLLGKMMSANIDIFDNSTTIRKQNEKNNEKVNITQNINQNNDSAVLPYFIAKQLRKFGLCFSRSVYYFYEILVLGPHAGESNMQEDGQEDEARIALQKDLNSIFLFSHSDLYYRSIEFSLLLQCFYIALWCTNFAIVGTDVTNIVKWEILLFIPIPLNFLILKLILNFASLLRSLSVLDEDIAARICEDALDERVVTQRLRKMVRTTLSEIEPEKENWHFFLNEVFSHYVPESKSGVSPKQFTLFLHGIQIHISIKSVKRIFSVIDFDQSGYITWDELSSIIFPELLNGSKRKEKEIENEKIRGIEIRRLKGNGISGEKLGIDDVYVSTLNAKTLSYDNNPNNKNNNNNSNNDIKNKSNNKIDVKNNKFGRKSSGNEIFTKQKKDLKLSKNENQTEMKIIQNDTDIDLIPKPVIIRNLKSLPSTIEKVLNDDIEKMNKKDKNEMKNKGKIFNEEDDKIKDKEKQKQIKQENIHNENGDENIKNQKIELSGDRGLTVESGREKSVYFSDERDNYISNVKDSSHPSIVTFNSKPLREDYSDLNSGKSYNSNDYDDNENENDLDDLDDYINDYDDRDDRDCYQYNSQNNQNIDNENFFIEMNLKKDNDDENSSTSLSNSNKNNDYNYLEKIEEGEEEEDDDEKSM